MKVTVVDDLHPEDAAMVQALIDLVERLAGEWQERSNGYQREADAACDVGKDSTVPRTCGLRWHDAALELRELIAAARLAVPDHLCEDVVSVEKAYTHYYRACPYQGIDVYRILLLFNVSDPCIQAAIKKMLVAGGRGGGKNISQDVKEAIASLQRWQEMRIEETFEKEST